jgi:hypothetical protein
MTTLVRSAWVMHLLAPDPKGPIASGKPKGAAAFEQAAAQCPGSPGVALGHPGRRFRVACGAVRRPTAEHRVTVTPEMVNCPKCVELLKSRAKAVSRV